MAVYSLQGQSTQTAYSKDGERLIQAYDVTGNELLENIVSLKVMTYNVGQWYIGNGSIVPSEKDAEYYALQNGMIAAANADILFINEYRANFSNAGRTAASVLGQHFPYIGTGGNVSSGYFGRCICSKYPISNYTTHSFSVGSGQYYDTATITVNGNPITLVVTHLQYSSGSQATKLTQFGELLAYLQTLTRFICGGDLNQLDCKSTSGSDYTDMIVPILNDGFHCANCTDNGFLVTYSDQPTATWDGCLDNIITSGNIAITNAYVDSTKLTDNIQDKTDHMPLIATLAVT